MYLSLRCEWFVDLFMGLSASPEDRRMADVVTTEDGSGSARHVTITNCSVFQLSQLTSLIKMRALYIEGDLRYNRDQHGSLNDVTQVSQTGKHICHGIGLILYMSIGGGEGL